MTWLRRYRINRFLRDSTWLPPLLGMVVALLVHPLVRQVDQILDLRAAIGPGPCYPQTIPPAPTAVAHPGDESSLRRPHRAAAILLSLKRRSP